jgi:peptide/nickel transport system substrate-binding protein
VYLTMNARKETPSPPLRDVRVRQAIMHAIDREAIVKYIVGDEARVLHTECAPGQFGCTDSGLPHYAYDPSKARQLLAAAGYPNGFTVDLYASSTSRRIETEAIINYLRAVGVNARLHALQTAAAGAAVMAGRAGLAVQGWGTNIFDVSDSVSVFHDFSPRDLSRDEEVRDLVRHGDSTLDPEARKKAYAGAFRLIAERAYVLPLHSMPAYHLAAEGLTVTPHQDGIVRFYEMSWK